MKSEMRRLLRDMKAAIQLGHPKSIAFVIQDMKTLPDIAANRVLEEVYLAQVILPLGVQLANPRVPVNLLCAHGQDDLAGLRAICAVALAKKYTGGENISAEDLGRLARDSRREVRWSLAHSLTIDNAKDPGGVLSLIRSWLQASSPRMRETAVLASLRMPETFNAQVLAWLDLLHGENHPDVIPALVDLMNHLARHGHAYDILQKLSAWSQETAVNHYLVKKMLAASWNKDYPDIVKQIRAQLAVR